MSCAKVYFAAGSSQAVNRGLKNAVVVQFGQTVGGASVLASRKPKGSPDQRLAESRPTKLYHYQKR
jgi:hypothetical protein